MPSTSSVPRRVQRRRRILDAVREAIVEEGVNEVRVRTLAQRSGVAVATLYNQFGSRDGLIAAALEQDFRGRFEPLSHKTQSLSPAEKFRRRINKSGRDIKRMKDYTGAVLSFFFQVDVDPVLRAVLHDYVKSDFQGIVDDIASLGDLHNWVDRDQFAGDIVTQLYSISLTSLQGYIPTGDLTRRLLHVGAISFAGISKGETRGAFEKIAENASHHGSRAASRPATRP